MSDRTAVLPETEKTKSTDSDTTTIPPGVVPLLVLSAWCGLVAGLLEVGTMTMRKQMVDPDHLYKISRHFVWLVPVIDAGIFVALGLLGCGLIQVWPRRGRRLFVRVLAALVVLPSILVAFPRIFSLSWLLMAFGLGTRIVPPIERHGASFRRLVTVSLPLAVAIVTVLGTTLWVSDQVKQASENSRSLPPPNTPNILLIVMDTVAAGHLGLHGYARNTSTSLGELAQRGIRFDSARSASSWTLPSHATMFTGRWLHELSVGWFTPLDRTFPTVAEYLGDRGYATAGFVGNTSYCGADSGLARGFSVYQDHIFPELTALKMAVLVNRAMDAFQVSVHFTEDWLAFARVLPYVQRVWRSLENDRKGASVVNREFLDWLSHRASSERPFLAFLNYIDAHFPYELVPARVHRFGVEPTDTYQRVLIEHWWDIDKNTLSPEGLAFAVNAYDDCVADLDEQVGKLVDELDRRGLLKQTWLIITSDHGESFGEHTGVFCHGASLYETELHVPLLVIPPAPSPIHQAVSETVSLRDMAATIVDLAGFRSNSPFPGDSLARYWKEALPPGSRSPATALAELVPTEPHVRDYWSLPKQLPPQGAIKQDEWSYIRRESDAREELFHLRVDPKEQHNLAGDPVARGKLEQMRAALSILTEGPLTPQRFSR